MPIFSSILVFLTSVSKLRVRPPRRCTIALRVAEAPKAFDMQHKASRKPDQWA